MHILNWKLISESCPTGKPYLGTTQKIFADSRLSRLKTKKQNNKDSRSFPNLSWFLFSFLNHKSSSLSPNISNIALGGFTVFVSCFLFFYLSGTHHIYVDNTSHHICVDSRPIPKHANSSRLLWNGLWVHYTCAAIISLFTKNNPSLSGQRPSPLSNDEKGQSMAKDNFS